VYPYWQASTADCGELALEQQKAFISWTNAEVCGMSFRAEHAESGNCSQNSIVAASVMCWWNTVHAV